MDGAAWIRSQLAGFTCAACGCGYRREGIRVLAQREELFFVALDCAECASEAVAIVSVEREEVHPSGARLVVGDLEATLEVRDRAGGRPIDATDILAMHEFLRGFDGDFRRLFHARHGHPSGPGGS